jgi:hypothetical protein
VSRQGRMPQLRYELQQGAEDGGVVSLHKSVQFMGLSSSCFLEEKAGDEDQGRSQLLVD